MSTNELNENKESLLEASIFFRNLTCLDHAYIDDKGMVRGCSYHVSATVTGKVTGNEHVVLDFSAGKKLIKQIIDDNKLGYDHKLLIYPTSPAKVTLTGIAGCMRIKTPCLDAVVPYDTLRVIGFMDLKNELDSYFKIALPDYNIEFKLEEKGFTRSRTYFHYVHGLKNSTSYGCQNIHHGHTSFVEVNEIGGAQGIGWKERDIARLFDDTILLNRENVVEVATDHVTIIVDTKLRGQMKATYFSENIMIMDTETTIEYMAEYTKQQLGLSLKGHEVFISEGLQKGCRFVC